MVSCISFLFSFFILSLNASTSMEESERFAEPTSYAKTVKDFQVYTDDLCVLGLMNKMAHIEIEQKFIDTDFKRKVEAIIIPEHFRKQYAAAVFLKTHLIPLKDTIPSLVRLNVCSEQNEALNELQRLSEQFMDNDLKKFIQDYEFFVKEISIIRSKVLSSWDGERFKESMLRGYHF